jgi:hypothetical protein
MILCRAKEVVIITDVPEIGSATAAVIANSLGPHVSCRYLTYSQCDVFWGGLVETTDLFVLELLRRYGRGLRAEGCALGARLTARGKGVLLISGLCLASQVDSACYWDCCSGDTLAERANELLVSPINFIAEIGRVALMFRRLLPIPPQHD